MRRDKSSIVYLAIFVFVIIFACYYIYLAEIKRIMQYSVDLGDGLAAAGTLGDTAGLINALFSGLAFGGVILTIIWQIRNDKRGRISDQRTQFENTFFNMTQTFEHIIEGLSIKSQEVDNSVDHGDLLSNIYGQLLGSTNSQEESNVGEGGEIKGRALFRYLYDGRKIDGKQLVESVKESGIRAYENVMDGILDHYFRYFYRILKFIDDTELIDNQQKYYYTSIFRAQLSRYELLMIYLNGLSKFGYKKLKPLLEKYCILKNLDINDIPEPSDTLDPKEQDLLKNGYSESVRTHRLIYDGNVISIIINTICYSIILMVVLALSDSCLNNFIFKDILSLPILNDNSGKIVCLILTFMILYGIQKFFDYKRVDVKNMAYVNKWDNFRFVLSNYYDSSEIQLIIPVVTSIFYLCGSHNWYGYGFIMYVNMIIVWLFIKPLMALCFTAYKFYQFK